MSLVAHQAGAYTGFFRRATPSIKYAGTLLHLGEERYYESKVSCPRTQRSAQSGLKPRLPKLESSPGGGTHTTK